VSDLLITTFSFGVELDGIDVAQFKEAAGFESTTEAIFYKECNAGRIVYRKTAGLHEWADVTLKRALSSSMSFWEWRKQVLDGQIDQARRDCSIVLYDPTGTEVVRYNLREAWISRWKGPDLDAESSAIALEEVTIVHTGLERVS
jgi:phage tail-like protein